MQRIKIVCGICKSTKFYSIHRGISKISCIIVCENCRHFYKKLKKVPLNLDCISPNKGSCAKECSFMKTRCKACWAIQILESCPHSSEFYDKLLSYLSEDCKKDLRGLPLKEDEVLESMQGTAAGEELASNKWVELPLTSTEVSKLSLCDQAESPPRSKKDDDGEEEEGREVEGTNTAMTELTLDEEEVDEEAVDDPGAMDNDKDSHQLGRLGERTKRRRKEVEYFSKPAGNRRRGKPTLYDNEGRLWKSGVDLCDCLQQSCPGCHFPCPKCRSPMCGNECRVNRKWHYERVEVEGTKLYWVNRFV